MNNEIEVKAKQELTDITDDVIEKYMRTFGIGNQLTKEEMMQFGEIAKAYQLNPFKREIYAVPYTKKVCTKVNGRDVWSEERALSLIVGYEVYLKRAERSGRMNGFEVKTDGTGENMRAIVVIYRKDWTHPLIHEVWFKEYNQENKMWKSKPRTMLKKVAMAQAFRLAFPDEFGGMPYVEEELEERMSHNSEPVKTEPEVKTPEPAKIVDVPTVELKKLTDAEYQDICNKLELCENMKQVNDVAAQLVGSTASADKMAHIKGLINAKKFAFEEKPQAGPAEGQKVNIGDKVESWFWKLNKEQRLAVMPPNSKLEKQGTGYFIVKDGQ